MEITIKMDNLEEIIKNTLNSSTTEALEKAFKEVVEEKLDNELHDTFNNIINNKIASYVDDYLKSTTITVGNNWDGNGIVTYTVEEYLKHKINKIFDEQVLTTTVTDNWSGRKLTKTLSFEEYLNNKLDIDKLVKPHIDKIADKTKQEVNNKIDSMFNNTMKSMLADNIFNILKSNDTYRNVIDNLKLLSE